MSPTRSIWLLAAFLCAALLAGCGSSSSTTTGTTATTSTSNSTPAASTPTTTVPTTTIPAAPSSTIARLAATVCSSTAERARLPAPMKAKVAEICHEVESGHEAQALAAARQICVAAINSIPGPKTAIKEKALKECTSGK